MMKSLRNAKTDKALCALERDNFSVGSKDEWTLMGGVTEIYLSQQKAGGPRSQSFVIPKTFFDKLIDAYMAEQKPRRAKAA